MKRIIVMFTVITILAVVGGALAFKSKTVYFFGLQYGLSSTSCTTLIQSTYGGLQGVLSFVTLSGDPGTFCISTKVVPADN